MTNEEKQRLNREATMREAQDLRVFVVGGGHMYCKMFFEAGLKGARSVDDADIICFTGGEDVDPSLYGEKAVPETHFNPARDEREMAIFKEVVKQKKPSVGICRGSQFLNVMNKGGLYQHVDNHGRSHSIIDCRSGEEREGMTSTHHQMMIPSDSAEIVALACQSLTKKSANGTEEREKAEWDDIEVLWYPDTLSLCFQPHPEFAHGGCRNYFLELFDEYILPAT